MARAKDNAAKASIADYKILISPVITEKTSVIGEEGRNVVFKVDRQATKTQIKQAVENVFNVRVAKVRTCNNIGKAKRVTGAVGRRPATRKAYVELEPGHTIDVVAGI